MEKKKINIVEVGPRDGFQSVKGDFIPTELKKEIIDLLIDAGVKHLEYSSFVSPKAIPQLADAADVTEYVLKKYPDIDLLALVPNMRGEQMPIISAFARYAMLFLSVQATTKRISTERMKSP